MRAVSYRVRAAPASASGLSAGWCCLTRCRTSSAQSRFLWGTAAGGNADPSFPGTPSATITQCRCQRWSAVTSQAFILWVKELAGRDQAELRPSAVAALSQEGKSASSMFMRTHHSPRPHLVRRSFRKSAVWALRVEALTVPID